MLSLRAAPVIAGAAGLLWFWAEWTPQRSGFQDTDSPAIGLAFLAAYPGAWVQGGLALAVFGIAMIVTVVSMREVLRAAGPRDASGASSGDVAVDTLSVVGSFAAAALFGMGCVRLSGGPVRYVQGLDQTWGEMAYTVTQFVGVQLLLTAGILLLSIWIMGVAVVGARRGVVPRAVALLAVLPGIRLLANPALDSVLPVELWIALVLAIPAAFVWLVLLGASRRAPRPAVAPATQPALL